MLSDRGFSCAYKVLFDVCCNCFAKKRTIRDLFHYSMRVGKAVWMNTAYYTKRAVSQTMELNCQRMKEKSIIDFIIVNEMRNYCFDPIWFQFNLIYVIAFADGGNFVADFFFFFDYACLWKGWIYFFFFNYTSRARVKCTVNQTEPTSFIQHLLLLYDVVALHIKFYYNFAFHLRMPFFSVNWSELLNVVRSSFSLYEIRCFAFLLFCLYPWNLNRENLFFRIGGTKLQNHSMLCNDWSCPRTNNWRMKEIKMEYESMNVTNPG